MATALVALDGVLRDAKRQPIPEGVALFNALKEGYRVVVAVDDKFADDHWLMMEGLTDYQELVAETPGSLRGGDRTVGQVDYLLGRGQQVGLVVSGDPSAVASVLERGVTAALFSHPKFTRPEYRPDFVGSVTPWDQLVSEIETQTRLENTLRAQEET